MILAVTGLRMRLIRMVPRSIMLATSAGIGLYLVRRAPGPAHAQAAGAGGGGGGSPQTCRVCWSRGWMSDILSRPQLQGAWSKGARPARLWAGAWRHALGPGSLQLRARENI